MCVVCVQCVSGVCVGWLWCVLAVSGTCWVGVVYHACVVCSDGCMCVLSVCVCVLGVASGVGVSVCVWCVGCV